MRTDLYVTIPEGHELDRAAVDVGDVGREIVLLSAMPMVIIVSLCSRSPSSFSSPVRFYGDFHWTVAQFTL